MPVNGAARANKKTARPERLVHDRSWCEAAEIQSGNIIKKVF